MEYDPVLLREYYEKHTIYRVITGSTSTGLNIKSETYESDQDEKAVCILSRPEQFLFEEMPETVTFHKPDVEMHRCKKFFSLLIRQNPTALSMLWVDPQFIVFMNKLGKLLREHRQLFLSLNCRESFGGYARDQLYRIQNALDNNVLIHEKYLQDRLNALLNTFEDKFPAFPSGEMAFNSVTADSVELSISFPNIPLTQLQGMLSEISNTHKSVGKLNHRNRKSEYKLSKHAMILEILLLNGIEILETGNFVVDRSHQRKELLAIRNQSEGFRWTEFFEHIQELQEKLIQAKKKSNLPAKPDLKKINELYQELMLEGTT